MKIFSSDWRLKYTGISILSNKVVPENDGFCLPGLTVDESRYFSYLLTRPFCSIKEEQWKNLADLNQKLLASKISR